MKHATAIRGMGYHLPEKVITNADLEKVVDTTDQWIQERTGIRERRMVDFGTPATDIAVPAAQTAMRQAGVVPADITHVIFATMTADSYCPSAACRLAAKLDVVGSMAFDVNAACSSFLYGMQTARGLCALEPEATALLCAVDVMSQRLDFTDRSTCILFGDGAGAAVVQADNGRPAKARVLDAILRSDGEKGDLLTVNGGGSISPYKKGDVVGSEYFIQMNGREVFKVAVRAMAEVAAEVLSRNELTMDDIAAFIPHQANLRIIDHVGRKLNVPEDKVYVNVDRFGNTSAASVAVALAEALEKGRLAPGDKALLATFGGGFTWGAALIEIPNPT